MNAQKLQISERPTLVLKTPLAQETSAVPKKSALRRFLTNLKTRLKNRSQSDLSLEAWRRLEFRNERHEESRDHYIKFMF